MNFHVKKKALGFTMVVPFRFMADRDEFGSAPDRHELLFLKLRKRYKKYWR